MQTAQQRITIGPTTPGQITAGSFFVTGLGTVNYQKVGKYYSNVWVNNSGGTPILVSDSAFAKSLFGSEIATALGVTVNTWYGAQNYGACTQDSSAGVTWNISNPPANNIRTFILGFLTN